ncbi:ABC transporter permease, partial [Bacteroidota bacterium]
MNSFQTIRIVARFEMKTLLRSWFFRIFAGLFILGIGIFNVLVFVEGSGAPWLYRALPAAIPYANLIILNLGQAIVAVFLASEFLKQDRKNDTVEVIYARSMTNGQYIIGKALGVISVFIILNLIILIMGIGFSFLSADSAKGIGEFFLYPILISIPTLVFILGLSFFLMTLLKNQAITFILLLGYIAITIFYLNEKYYHLFDYIAYKIPIMNSMIAGFGNLTEIIIHRSIYFLIGTGLICFTVFKLNRLPQSRAFSYLPLTLAFVFISLGFYLGYSYIN